MARRNKSSDLARNAQRRCHQGMVRCDITLSEAMHILSLIGDNERNGEYTAPRNQYWARSNRIKAKLEWWKHEAPNGDLTHAGKQPTMNQPPNK